MSFSPLPSALINALSTHENIIISGHYRPDGDAIGSTIALGLALREAGKNVTMINEDIVPPVYQFLTGANKVLLSAQLSRIPENSLFIAVDTATKQRLGESAIAIAQQCHAFINIDHHESNERYGEINYIVSEQPATGALVYQIITELGLPFPDGARDALYVALSTDTGSFQYKGTTAHTMEIAADLIYRGVDVPAICQKIYDEQPWRKTLLTKAILEELIRNESGSIAYTSLSNITKESLHILPEDTEGLINFVRCIEGVKVAAFFEEIENDTRIRISLRSKNTLINVSSIAQQFGGGGHPMAAGLRMQGPLPIAIKKVIAAITKAIETL